MSGLVTASPLMRWAVACLVTGSVIAYENAYDLLERRNQRMYEPRNFHYTSLYDDRNRFFDENRNLRSRYVNPHFSEFGNGYDNLGNGIPGLHSRPFLQQLAGSWRFERQPFRERTFTDFGFQDYSLLRNPHREGYYPTFSGNLPSSSTLTGRDYRSRNNMDFAKVDRFFEDNEDKKQKKTDEIYQRSQEGVNMDSVKKEKSGEELHTGQVGENKSTLRSNKVAKKGRTTKGFAVHHHKDETGNSTMFFDESSDFGGQSDLRDITDGFDTRGTIEHVLQKSDEKYLKENGGQTGNYGSGLLLGKQRFEKDFSSADNRRESGKKFQSGIENEGFGHRKIYQYLNGDPFEYVEEPQVNNFQ